MSGTKNEGKRGFIVLSRAWYAEANRTPDRIDEITAGPLNADGSPSDAISIEWRVVGSEVGVHLGSFHDGWSELAASLDVVRALGELAETCGQHAPTVDDVVAVLAQLGFEDVTPTENPNA